MPAKNKALGHSLLNDESGGEASSSRGGAAADSQVAQVQAQVDQVRATMQENVNVMVENIEKGSNLEARSEALASQAQVFSRTARRTSRHMWWQNCKMKIIWCAPRTRALSVGPGGPRGCFFSLSRARPALRSYGGITLGVVALILLICNWAGVFNK